MLFFAVKGRLVWVLVSFFVCLTFESKIINKSCPPNHSSTKSKSAKRHQRLFLFSNAVLKVTPNIEIPFELAENIGTGFKISVPISVRFQSQFELMSEWIKQLIASKAKVLSKNFNSITGLLGITDPVSNVGPKWTATKSSAFHADSTPGDGISGPVTSGGSNDIDSGSASDATNNDMSDNSSDTNGNQECTNLFTQLSNTARANSRSLLYKSFEISHSKLGKSCLQRAVCEVSQTPLLSPNSGLLGELIDMFLTVNPLHEEFGEEFVDYSNAQSIGKMSFIKQSSKRLKNTTFIDDCQHYYGTDCPFSLFNIYNHLIPITV